MLHRSKIALVLGKIPANIVNVAVQQILLPAIQGEI
jgi:hypothetical protein